jgi:hypothetical protein
LYPFWYLSVEDSYSSCTMTNSSILDMFRFLYGGGGGYNRFGAMLRVPLNRVKLIGADTSRLVPLLNDKVQLKNIFSYQLFMKHRAYKTELIDRSLKDVAEHFQVEVYWKKERKKCLVFTMFDSTLAMYQSGAPITQTADVKFKMNNCTVTEMMQDMEAASNYYDSPYPLVDETGYSGLIGDIEIETDVYNYAALDEALKKYGIRLKLESREIPLLTIVDRKPK